MTRPQAVLRFAGALVVITLAGAAHLAVRSATYQYVPEVGMPGRDAVWVPSPPETIEMMLDFAEVTPEDVVIDLGSGDGPIVIAAARRGARAIGVEYNPDLVELSKQRAAEAGVGERAMFIQGDMYEADISEATVLALFLLPENLENLTPRFLQLAPGTRIVVNTFGIPGWDADERRTVAGECVNWCQALLYIVPATAEGTWRLPQGTLTLEQDFQMLTGRLVSENGTTPVEDGRLRGDEIRFTVGETVYTGRIDGDRLEGTATAEGRRHPFTANRTREVGELAGWRVGRKSRVSEWASGRGSRAWPR
jgi:SAM-dependent methyltransferase